MLAAPLGAPHLDNADLKILSSLRFESTSFETNTLLVLDCRLGVGMCATGCGLGNQRAVGFEC
jgi:hypothetical protein